MDTIAHDLSPAFSRTNPWTVYMLVNGQGRTYVGITTDVERRLRQHNGTITGGARATRGRGPWQVLYVEPGFTDRAAAQSREYHLKKDRATRRRLVRDLDAAAVREPRHQD